VTAQKSLSGSTLVIASAGSNADGTVLRQYGNRGGEGISSSGSDSCQGDWCGGGGGGAGAVGGAATRASSAQAAEAVLPSIVELLAREVVEEEELEATTIL
jgi:hypothetical protein